jgi:hypothetical protein
VQQRQRLAGLGAARVVQDGDGHGTAPGRDGASLQQPPADARDCERFAEGN